MKLQFPLIALSVLLAGCGFNQGVVTVKNSASQVVTSVDIALSRDAAGADLMAHFVVNDVRPGTRLERTYTIDSEYYMTATATLADGTTLTNPYGYVLDEEWRPARHLVEVTSTGIVVNGH
jgi:hypothetical protein